MGIEIIVIGAFALIVIGRIAWEKRADASSSNTDTDEWMTAIK